MIGQDLGLSFIIYAGPGTQQVRTVCEKYVQLQDVYPKSHHSKLSISATTSPSALNPINPDPTYPQKVYKRKKIVFSNRNTKQTAIT